MCTVLLLYKQLLSLFVFVYTITFTIITGFSGADIWSLCGEAAMGPVRGLQRAQLDIRNLQVNDVPPIAMTHFNHALRSMRPSVSVQEIKHYIK
jgi:SpoVK/Ycf46/Vps4 family AAA+-type ATPase